MYFVVSPMYFLHAHNRTQPANIPSGTTVFAPHPCPWRVDHHRAMLRASDAADTSLCIVRNLSILVPSSPTEETIGRESGERIVYI